MDRSVKAPGADLDEWREVKAVAGLAVGVPALVETAGAAVWTAPLYGGPAQDVMFSNPAGLAWHLFGTHELAWSPAAWGGLATVVGGTAAGVLGSVLAARWACGRCRDLLADRKAAKGKKRATGPATPNRRNRRAVGPAHAIDEQARYLAHGYELADMTFEAMVAKAADLGVARRDRDAPGVTIGQALLDPAELYGSYEDLHLDVMGPRGGKSSTRVIPAVMEAWGPVVATSNKRDVVDATRLHRDDLGRAWVFDPQGVAQEPCSWFWDPIAWVGADGGAEAQERAARLAGHFAAAGDADKRDAFFDPEGEDLLAGLFLACALAKRPVTQAYRWVTDPHDEEPVDIVRGEGYELVAAALNDQYNAPDRQRAGIFSTAKKMAVCLRYERIHPWVCPPKDGEAERDPFDVAAFARSRDTLYPLSLEGKGTAAPLVTAMTAAVVEAASEEGVRHGGRLPVPMLVCLDEAANIVKWAELPKMYSHFGSRGIVVMTILQSWAQGVRCWGDDGMKALWSASNVRLIGRGLADAGFLRDISDLVGAHYEQVSSLTNQRSKDGGRSTSTSWSRTTEPTLTASDLAAIPPGRALLMASGRRPALIRLVPWWERPYADAVKASQRRYEPTPDHSQADGWSAPSATDQEGDDA